MRQGRFVLGRILHRLSENHARCPLLTVTLSTLAGIVTGYGWGHLILAGGSAALLTLGFAGAAMWRYRRQHPMSTHLRRPEVPLNWRHLLFMPLLFYTLGWMVAAHDQAGRAREAAAFKAGTATLTFSGCVGEEVVITPLKGAATKQQFTLREFCSLERELKLRQLPVGITWYGGADNGPRPGEVWHLRGKGRVRKRRNGLLEVNFNVAERDAHCLRQAQPASWRVRVDKVRRAAVRRVALGIEDWGDIAALNQAMLLGRRHEMPPQKREIFVRSGTIHVYAISGLHIVLVAAVLSLLVSILGVPKTWWVVWVGPPLIFYTILTGARASAVRACLMTIIYLLAPLVGRRPSGWGALLGTALVLHLGKPWLIYDVGSILSFSVMGGLVLFCAPFCAVGRRVLRVQALREHAHLYQSAGRAWYALHLERLAWLLQGISDSLAVSLSAFLASLPLTAHYFGRLTPGGLLANLVVGPCAFMIVVAGCLGMLTSLFSTWLATCFNHAAGFFTCVMVKVAEWTVAIPGSNFKIKKWPAWGVWLWFGILMLLVLWRRVRKRTVGSLEWLAD